MSGAAAVSRLGPVAQLVIGGRENGNAVRGNDLIALTAALRDAQRDPEVRVIVVTGAGPKFFCTGSDITELAGGVPDIGVHLGKWHEFIDCLATSEKPVIAALNGLAVGGGFEIALACHRRIASDTVRVGLPELNVGLFPAAGGVRRLTRLLGTAGALALVLDGELLGARDALALGVLDMVVPAPELEATVEATAQRLAALEPNALRATLICARAAELGVDTNDLEATLLRECYANARNREVLESFLARRRRT